MEQPSDLPYPLGLFVRLVAGIAALFFVALLVPMIVDGSLGAVLMCAFVLFLLAYIAICGRIPRWVLSPPPEGSSETWYRRLIRNLLNSE